MIQYVYFLLTSLEKPRPCMQAGVCVCVSALFVVMKNWNLPKCPAIGEWLNRLSHKLITDTSAGQGATVRTGHGTTDLFQIGKGVHQGCVLSPCLFNLYAEYIMRNAGLEEA